MGRSGLCWVLEVTCTVKLSASTSARALLFRGGAVYARGSTTRGSTLRLRAARKVPAGRYTLTLITGSSVARSTVTVR